MSSKNKNTEHRTGGSTKTWIFSAAAGLLIIYAIGVTDLISWQHDSVADAASAIVKAPQLDKADYNRRMLRNAQYVPPLVATSTASTTPVINLPEWTATTSVSVFKRAWPVATAYPKVGALLPFNRIVAYYGNFYSKQMGVLGEYPEAQMLAMLASTSAAWAAADPDTPVVPAIDYIAVTAQGSAGKDGKYRLQMPDSQIDKALLLAAQARGIVILDVQVGLSDLPHELPELRKYLSMPQVHLAIDPEFAMHNGQKPGTYIGTMSATDVNYAANFLAQLVREYNLPPKILIVHRFTEEMVTGYRNILPLPEVQIVMDMDGWGDPAKKMGTYRRVIYSEPVQFTGFKLFYKNDLKPPSTRLLSMEEVLKITPAPLFIQYQ